MSKVIAVAIPKGGTGKTTSAVTLASAAQFYNRRVLLVDLDPQAQCSTALGVKRGPGLYNVAWKGEPLAGNIVAARPGCDLLPGDRDSTAGFQDNMVGDPWGVQRLSSALNGQVKDYDLIFLDCPPTQGRLNAAALMAATGILIPVQCNFLSLESLGQFLEQLKNLRALPFGPKAKIIAVVPTFYSSRTIAGREAYQALQAQFGTVASEPIPRTTEIERAAAEGQTVWEYCPGNRATKAYARLADWVYTRWL